MIPISRRAFVVGSSGAALAVGSPVARADHSRHRDVHGGLLDDAAMVGKRLPDSRQVPGAEQVKGEPPLSLSGSLARQHLSMAAVKPSRSCGGLFCSGTWAVRSLHRARSEPIEYGHQ